MPLFGLKSGRKQAEVEERCVRANDRHFNLQFNYAKNSIKTSKYNALTFLPLNLFEQFQRVANAYFLFLLILQLIPEISSLSWFTTVTPLILVLTVSAAKDAIDDVNRHTSDKQVNNRPIKLLIDGRLKNDLWRNVEVGDIVKLENNNFVTADLLLLSSSEPHGLAYIETAELDGETNLKVKQALTVTAELGGDLQALGAFDGEIHCEAPNNKLDRFTGTLTFKGQKYSLGNDNMILRGCTMRNTEWSFGLVIFAGPETKLMQNSGKSIFKRTRIERLMNFLVLMIFLMLGAMCLILAISNGIWEYSMGYSFHVYLPRVREVHCAAFSAFLMFWSYVIILNTLVPISLYVSVEIIRLGNSFYINWDHKMYYARSDTPAQARTTTLNEELGQIKYIFSDKTGTLTQNIMVFNKCCINGKRYGDVFDSEGHLVEISEGMRKVDFSYNPLADPNFAFYDQSLVEAVKRGNKATHQFFRLLSLCHTVMSEEKEKGMVVYQAQSPDEGALVTAARNFGFVFWSRTPKTITVVEMGKTIVYELLAILDFSNVRKRMSVIVRNPEGKVTLYCKGADTVLYELLDPSCELKEETTECLDEFAGEGLRTLVVAYKDLDPRSFEEWQKRHLEASLALEQREDRLSEVYEEIETDLLLLGATAIEDKLQEGVTQTIENLGKAQIKIWVLTGDKQETALNICYSCNMFYDAMKDIFIIQGNSSEQVQRELRKARKKMRPSGFVGEDEVGAHVQASGRSVFLPDEEPNGEYGLVINGHSLAYALEGNLEQELLRTACLCKTVICCRVTPLQKAQMVSLVKKYKKAVTLAIGDGANDVGMIKTADIGVGISGQEGMQAVLSSDYSFAQFRYLQRLLLVHGRWSYLRMCKFLAYFFYKNFVFTLVHLWYATFSGFSAQTVYDEWFITLYNLVYTSLPVLGLSLFEQDVNDRWSLQFPQLYVPGQQDLYFNKRVFVKCLLYSVYSSVVLFLVPYATMKDSLRRDGKAVEDYQTFALMAQTCLLVVVSIQIALDTAYWTSINQLFVWGSLAMYFAITFTMYTDGTYLIFTGSFPFVGTARNTLNQPAVWLAILLCAILCVMPMVAFRFLKMQFRPTVGDKVLFKVRELQRQPMTHLPKRSFQRRASHRSGYAFSHQEGFGALITSGWNMGSRSPFGTSGSFSPNSEAYRLKFSRTSALGL